jgi:hypothetical protein
MDLWMLGIFAAYLGILFGFRPAIDKIDRARKQILLLRRDLQHKVKTIRELAVSCLRIKRHMRALAYRQQQVEAEIRRTEEQLDALLRHSTRLVVMDERRLAEDQRFVVTVSGEDRALPEAVGDEGNESWDGSLRFMVWAPTVERAIYKALIRYPQSRGFKIDDAQPWKEGSVRAA